MVLVTTVCMHVCIYGYLEERLVRVLECPGCPMWRGDSDLGVNGLLMYCMSNVLTSDTMIFKVEQYRTCAVCSMYVYNKAPRT